MLCQIIVCVRGPLVRIIHLNRGRKSFAMNIVNAKKTIRVNGLGIIAKIYGMHIKQLVQHSVAPIQKIANEQVEKKKRGSKTIDQRRQENRSSKAYGKLPNMIRNDRQLLATGLVVIAYRSTFAGRYQLRPELLQCIASNKPSKAPTTGLSRNGLASQSVRKAMNNLCDLEYLHRTLKGRQVRESIGFETTENTPQIKRCWFDGSLSLNALAVFIWLKVNPGSYAREVKERFRWSRKTAELALKELVDKEWIEPPEQERDSNGRYNAARYRVVKRSDGEHLAAGNLTEGQLAEGQLGGSLLNLLPTTQLDPLTKEVSLDAFHKSERSDTSEPWPFIKLLDDAYTDKLLLGWLVETENAHFAELTEKVTDQDRKAIAGVLQPQDILDRIRSVTNRQISPKIANLKLAISVIEISASLLANADGTIEPHQAIENVLADIEQRIGQKGEWLTNLKLIGKRVMLKPYPTVGDEPSAGAGLTEGLVEQFRRIDVNGVLSNLLLKPKGLQALINEFGDDRVFSAVSESIVGFVIDGVPEEPPKSWRYFRPKLEDESKKMEMGEYGMRPGDMPGDWRNQPLITDGRRCLVERSLPCD